LEKLEGRKERIGKWCSNSRLPVGVFDGINTIEIPIQALLLGEEAQVNIGRDVGLVGILLFISHRLRRSLLKTVFCIFLSRVGKCQVRG